MPPPGPVPVPGLFAGLLGPAGPAGVRWRPVALPVGLRSRRVPSAALRGPPPAPASLRRLSPPAPRRAGPAPLRGSGWALRALSRFRSLRGAGPSRCPPLRSGGPPPGGFGGAPPARGRSPSASLRGPAAAGPGGPLGGLCRRRARPALGCAACGRRLTILKLSSVPLRAPRVPQVGPGGQWLGKRRERRRGRSGGPWEALRRGNAAEPAGRWRTAGIEKDLSAGSEVIFSGFDACGMG